MTKKVVQQDQGLWLLKQFKDLCVAECMVKVTRPAGYGGSWEGYGESKQWRTGPECAEQIERLYKAFMLQRENVDKT